MKRLPSIIVLIVFAAVSLAARPTAPSSLLLQGAAASGGMQVADAKLGKAVENKEIKDESTSFAVGEKAYLWMKITGGPGDLKVSWKVGEATDTVSLTVGASSWRTWSNKTLHKAGDWTVTVTDAGGAVLKELTFKVQ
jgi:hypothetical protein